MRSSTILRKLGTDSRKNKLYVAFRELGRVVRTLFLLQFISDEELRRTINAATNIVEAWNGFVQWVAFGGEASSARTTAKSNARSSATIIWWPIWWCFTTWCI